MKSSVSTTLEILSQPQLGLKKSPPTGESGSLRTVYIKETSEAEARLKLVKPWIRGPNKPASKTSL